VKYLINKAKTFKPKTKPKPSKNKTESKKKSKDSSDKESPVEDKATEGAEGQADETSEDAGDTNAGWCTRCFLLCVSVAALVFVYAIFLWCHTLKQSVYKST